jgi:probable rRNA maturation factor
MILLDPDLEPDAAPRKISAKRVDVPGKAKAKFKTTPRDVQLPSARTLARFLAAAQAAVRLKGQVTVLLTTDAAIARLNKQFRGKNKATDVLSFPVAGPGAEGMAGDLAISVTTALGQAAEQGHSLSMEIKVLVLHGLLHLAGYDHEADEGQMARRERLLRAKLKLPQGLIERVAGIPSGAKARGSLGGLNVRAEARTLHSALELSPEKSIPQGLKPKTSIGAQSARLKSGPFKAKSGEQGSGLVKIPSGAKARGSLGGFDVRAEARTLRPSKARNGAEKTRIAAKAKRP